MTTATTGKRTLAIEVSDAPTLRITDRSKLGQDILSAVAEYNAATAEMTSARKRQERARERIESLRDGQTVLLGKVILVQDKPTSPRFAQAAFREANPDLYAKWCQPATTFTVAKLSD